MINRCLLSLLFLAFTFSDLLAYNADSGECMLMENIKELLEEYKSYNSNIKAAALQLATYSGANGLIASAKGSAESARSSVEGINNKAATKSKWAGGLSLASTAANVVSTGLLAGAFVNNNKTMKNLDNMHSTLSEMNIDGKSVIDREITDNQIASEGDVDDLKNKAKCLKDFYDNYASGKDFDRKEEESIFLTGDDDNIDVGFLAYRENKGKRQAYYCGEVGIKAELFINMFSKDKLDFNTGVCSWSNIKDIEVQSDKGPGSPSPVVSDDPGKLLKKAANIVSNKFDSMINGGVFKGTNRKTAKKFADITCEGGIFKYQIIGGGATNTSVPDVPSSVQP